MTVRFCTLALASSLVLPIFNSPADTILEDFSSDPATRGWRAVGQTNLFAWNATNQDLEVTWDSSQTNSYFCKALGFGSCEAVRGGPGVHCAR